MIEADQGRRKKWQDGSRFYQSINTGEPKTALVTRPAHASAFPASAFFYHRTQLCWLWQRIIYGSSGKECRRVAKVKPARAKACRSVLETERHFPRLTRFGINPVRYTNLFLGLLQCFPRFIIRFGVVFHILDGFE